MSGFSRDLSNFVVEIKFEDLPKDVVHEAKRVLLDSIGCAIAGIASDKGKIAIQFARRLGGTQESSVIGVGDKVSCSNAAFANGELINALDYDAVSHIPPFVIPPSLAVAESTGASGKDLIVATVLAQEISKRFPSALTSMKNDSTEEGRPPAVHGVGQECIFGGTIGVGKVLKLDQKEMSHALGLAGCYCPVPSSRKEFDATPRQMVKYAPAGWLCSGAVTCALLAGMGFTGDTTVFDGEYGFWRFYGSKKWEPDVVLDKLGKRWLFLEISYKPYACCRYFHSQLDCFISIIEKNNLRPEEIEKVRSFGFPFFTDSPPQEVITQIDAQFCAPYVFAVAAHRVKIGADWQDWDTIRNPKIKEFMKKVTVQVHPEAVGAKNKDRRSWLAKVEIEARGKTFTEERMHAKGTAFTDVRATDEELVAKFRGNAIRFLTEDKIEKAVKMLYELEKMDNVGELMKQVTL